MLNHSASLAMSTSILKALPGKLDIKRRSPSILYLKDFEHQFNPGSTLQSLYNTHKGFYMSAHVLLNLLNKLGKRDKNARLVKHFISFSQQV